jgi:hypothetical protein
MASPRRKPDYAVPANPVRKFATVDRRMLGVPHRTLFSNRYFAGQISKA